MEKSRVPILDLKSNSDLTLGHDNNTLLMQLNFPIYSLIYFRLSFCPPFYLPFLNLSSF